MSLLDTSYLSPTDANDDTPIPSLVRCSSTAIPMPPDWTTRPALPGGGWAPAKVAFRPSGGAPPPQQAGAPHRTPRVRREPTTPATRQVRVPPSPRPTELR